MSYKIIKKLLDRPRIVFDKGEISIRPYQITKIDESSGEEEDARFITAFELSELLDGDGYLPELAHRVSGKFKLEVVCPEKDTSYSIAAFKSFLDSGEAYDKLAPVTTLKNKVPRYFLKLTDAWNNEMRLELAIVERGKDYIELAWVLNEKTEATKDMLVYLCTTLYSKNLIKAFKLRPISN